jgi:hypothetical protein
MKKLSLLVLTCVLPFGGCSSMPKATVFIMDESGKPVEGASVNPFILRPFASNVSDKKGRATLYNRNEGTVSFTIFANGFEEKTIPFPGDGGSIKVILKRVTE